MRRRARARLADAPPQRRRRQREVAATRGLDGLLAFLAAETEANSSAAARRGPVAYNGSASLRPLAGRAASPAAVCGPRRARKHAKRARAVFPHEEVPILRYRAAISLAASALFAVSAASRAPRPSRPRSRSRNSPLVGHPGSVHPPARIHRLAPHDRLARPRLSSTTAACRSTSAPGQRTLPRASRASRQRPRRASSSSSPTASGGRTATASAAASGRTRRRPAASTERSATIADAPQQ